MKKAIYREYRPKTFKEVLGQKHITQILENQVKNDNIGHAYIFSGTRGTGKTSCAKILARAVNCLNPVDGSPCNECENCKSILNEETLDIVEMDAASNRRIDDIRELRDKVVYPPANLKYKVYIIDEAHMITNEGFNALLKIMEEPPKHLIFILATTEIEKIPQTILSRCQRYEFKRIDISDIKKNLLNILSDLDINMEEDAIDLIASYADGAMRDALSTLDQVISIGKKDISLEDVENTLGIVDTDNIFNLVQSILDKDFINSLNNLHISSQGKSVISVFQELISHYRNLLLVKHNLVEYMDVGKDFIEKYKIQASHTPMEQIVDSLEILLEYELKLKTSENPKVLSEICITRLVDYINYDDLRGELRALKRKVEILETNGVALNSTLNVEEKTNIKPVKKPSTLNQNIIKVQENKKEENEKEDKPETLVLKEIDNIDIVEKEKKEKKPKEEKSTPKEIDIEGVKFLDLKDEWPNIISEVKSPMLEQFMLQAEEVFIDAGKFIVIYGKENAHNAKFLTREPNLGRVKSAVKSVLNKEMPVHFYTKGEYTSPNIPKGKDNIELLEKVFGKGNFKIK